MTHRLTLYHQMLMFFLKYDENSRMGIANLTESRLSIIVIVKFD